MHLRPIALAFAFALSSCRSGCHGSGAPDAAVAVEPPVPPPDRRIADVVLATPDATWGRLQRGIGGGAGVLPATFGGVACVAAGLDITVASEVDGAAAAFGVLALEPDGGLGWTFAVKLVDARHALSVLAEADTARFVAKPAGSIVVLSPKASLASVVAGVAKAGYLLIAPSEATLMRLGPYAYRTLPTRPVGSDALVAEFPHEALAVTMHDALVDGWTKLRTEALKRDEDMRAQHGGKAPDFGDAAPIVASADAAVDKLKTLLADLDQARLAVNFGQADVDASLTLTPSAGGGPASKAIAAMHPGDASPLGTLPAGVTLGVLVRDDAAGRAKEAESLESTVVGALGGRLKPDEAQKLHAVISDWEAARGDWLTIGLSLDGGLHANARAPAADPAKAGRALRDGVALLNVPAFGGPLKQMLDVRDVKVTSRELPGLGTATVATLTRSVPRPDFLPKLAHGTPPLAQGPPSVGLAWAVANGDVRVAIAEDAAAALAASAAPPKTLADDPSIAAALGELGPNVTFALIGQPPASQPGTTPLVFGWGKNAERGWAHLSLADSFLRDALKRFSGP